MTTTKKIAILGLSALTFGATATAAPAKKKPAAKSSVAAKGKSVLKAVGEARPGMLKFALKGGIMIPKEGRIEEGFVVGLEASLKLPALGKLSLQGDLATGDLELTPRRNTSADQRYLHLNYILTPKINSPVGKVYYGFGITQAWAKAAGATASKMGANAIVGYQFPNNMMVEGRYSFVGSDRGVDMGGTSIMGGYRF